MDYSSLGGRIRDARRARNWTQAELARRIGCSVSFIGHIERGSRIASVGTLSLICDTLEVSTDYVLGKQNASFLMLTSEEYADLKGALSCAQTILLRSRQREKLI